MGLTGEEKRRLREIGRDLERSDPVLARRLGPPGVRARRTVLGFLLLWATLPVVAVVLGAQGALLVALGLAIVCAAVAVMWPV
ncbi:hypothetical protein Lfu02_12280 [Longispora fulva]|uniref:DUF3040 domain-containing protein n=1 Tax=Longispora fulva TaxID=619741 RepID=A0A8J7KV68_9ACTN|nr:DUF3040 domain-containing protein [Longispora fulva]MBG6134912.1 hypothetical protein [Longispora fulva]GIG56856.1 hypothetical protein Lfu02_12280 [Longispora fulva]